MWESKAECCLQKHWVGSLEKRTQMDSSGQQLGVCKCLPLLAGVIKNYHYPEQQQSEDSLVPTFAALTTGWCPLA